MITSQLFLSSDLRTLDPEAKAIVLNKEVLAVNQDKLGKMGQRIHKVSLSFMQVVVIHSSYCSDVHVCSQLVMLNVHLLLPALCM